MAPEDQATVQDALLSLAVDRAQRSVHAGSARGRRPGCSQSGPPAVELRTRTIRAGRHCFGACGTMLDVDTHRATGWFEVDLLPLPTETPALGRLSIQKRFEGELTGTSRGEMLSFGSRVQGSAGYTAVEVVTGTLHGRSGSFALQHSGTMTRGTPELVITVIPDSGSDGLEGLSGHMTLHTEPGRKGYVLEYTFRAEDRP